MQRALINAQRFHQQQRRFRQLLPHRAVCRHHLGLHRIHRRRDRHLRHGRLYDDNGNELTRNDDGGTGRNFNISHEVTAGTYYVKVNHYCSIDTGSYTLRYGFTPDTTPTQIPSRPSTSPPAPPAPAPAAANAQCRELSLMRSGSISYSGDSENYYLTVQCAGTIWAYTEYTGDETDTYGRLYDNNGNELTRNDDGGTGRNFNISHEVTAGTYYVKVNHYCSIDTSRNSVHYPPSRQRYQKRPAEPLERSGSTETESPPIQRFETGVRHYCSIDTGSYTLRYGFTPDTTPTQIPSRPSTPPPTPPAPAPIAREQSVDEPSQLFEKAQPLASRFIANAQSVGDRLAIEYNPPNNLCLLWDGVEGSTYKIEAALSLIAPQWTTLKTVTAASTGRIRECFNHSDAICFFRVTVTDVPDEEIDPYSDNDNDGLPHAAELKLHTRPGVADAHPLRLSGLPVQASGILTVNLNISSQVPAGTDFSLVVDGEVTGDAFIEKDGNQWKLHWNTRHTPNGSRSLQLQTQYPGIPGDYRLVRGEARSITVNNRFTFDPLASQFDEYLNIIADVNGYNPADPFDVLIDFYDEDDTYLASLATRPQNSRIAIRVDIGPDTPLPDDKNIRAEFFLVQPLAALGGAVTVAAASGPEDRPDIGNPVQETAFTKEESWNGDDFVVAWGWDSEAIKWGGLWRQEFEHKHRMIQNGIINIIANPAFPDNREYRVLPSPNGYDVGTTFQFRTGANKRTLLDTLALPNSRNFFWFGHGHAEFIAPRTPWFWEPKRGAYDPNNPPDDAIYTQEIAETLGNSTKIVWDFRTDPDIRIKHPYRLVILMGCETVTSTWPNVFGISPETSTVQKYLDLGRKPRAIVLWHGEIKVPQGAHLNNIVYAGRQHNEMAEALAVLFSNWMQNKPLNECMRLFAEKALEHGFTEMDTWQIYGCEDLRRNGP
ncbi:MAG: hypothetical protein M2R46_02992 [Verrucomicrobia subdivision 3 bacterium]|nr:hypothetical protein [Limisphaerales bacterium]